MVPESLMLLLIPAAVIGLILAVGLALTKKTEKLDARLDALSGKAAADEKRAESVAAIARTALPKMGKAIIPDDAAERTKLQARLVHAGFYGRQAMHAFLGVKLAMLILATLVGVGLTLAGILGPTQSLPIAMVLFLMGMVGPSFWLDKRKKARQMAIRRALPDALDVLIICLEGGLSLQAAIKKVAEELRSAHPTLGGELRIVDREIGLGRPPGEALNNFARRTDMEEVLSLASVIGQSEKFGASLVKSLRSHSEGLRHRRKQIAEEKAAKAATKIMIPTVLLIFPAVFVVLLGPAAFQVMETFGEGAQPKVKK